MENDRHERLESAELAAILDGAVDAIITIDARGTIISANQPTQTMFGYSVAELMGVNVRKLMPEPYHTQHDGYIQTYCATGVKKIIGIGREVTALRKDGSVFPIHLAVSEVMFKGTRLFTGIIRDISDVKAAQRELELAQEKLVQKERLAAIGQTVTGLAHESRNAFQRSHACLAELSLDLTDMPESLLLVTKVQKALDDLHRLLEEVRLYAAPIVLDIRECNLVALVRESWQQVTEARSTRAHPEFEVIVADGFPEVCRLDSDRIRQVLRNGFENAVQASANDGKILVELELASDQIAQLVLKISDTGPGVAEKDRESIFQPFFTTRTKGTGLGLAITRRILDAHDGSISVGTAKSGGAEFVIVLPNRPGKPG